jgi:hypothetical protein
MSGIGTESRSLRAEQLRARAPRIAFYAVVVVLCLAGLRTILAGTPAPAVRAATTTADAQADQVAATFAEAFARAYLTWNADDPDARSEPLAAFVSSSFGGAAGVMPGDGTSQSVEWTAVVGQRRDRRGRIVTVAAQTDERMVYLSVPVARDASGALRIAGYPAIVGPPKISSDTTLDSSGEDEVTDAELETVAVRAITNYLARAERNLAADLVPDAVISLPEAVLTVAETERVTWVEPGRRVAVQLQARDEAGTAWTLRYELDVQLNDRWYVRAIHVDPTSRGGS